MLCLAYTETYQITRIDFYHDGFIQVSFWYDDYRPVLDVHNVEYYLPFKSQVHLPTKEISIYFEVDRYQINTVFPTEMFQMKNYNR